MAFRKANLNQHLAFNDDRYLLRNIAWRDELGDIATLARTGTGVSINTTEGTVDFTTGAALTDFVHTNVQLNHDLDLTSAAIHPHIHWFQQYNATPNFLIQYRWQKNSGVKTTAWTDLRCNTNAFSYTVGTLHQLSYCSIAIPENTLLSDIVQFKIFRDNANTSGVFAGADGYTGTVSLLSFDVHLTIDGLGSSSEFVK